MECEPYPVTCARCGTAGTSATFVIEEGDEWECPPCNARENARERAEFERERPYGVCPGCQASGGDSHHSQCAYK